MSDYMKQLEVLDNLEGDIIKETKVHKVLKNILKLDRIPRDEELSIKKRSQDLLTRWSGVLNAGDDAATEPVAPATNGVKAEEKKTDGSAADESAEKSGDAPAAAEETKAKDADGDVAMAEPTEAPKESKDEAPAAQTNGDAVAEKAADAVEATA